MSDSHSVRGSADAERSADPFDPMPSIRATSVARMRLQPGQRVLDIGCGNGDDTLALARIVGRGGIVFGVDYDAAMIANARQRSRNEDVAGWITYHHANAAALPWPDNYFNVCRSDRVFQNMLGPAHAFDEMLRVAQPGARVVVVDGDWTRLGFQNEDGDIESQCSHFLSTLPRDNRVSGQCLRRLLDSRGLTEIEVDVLPLFSVGAGPATAADPATTKLCWQRSCSNEAAAAGLFASANALVISGRKAESAR